jgi:spore maturation protein CgeB
MMKITIFGLTLSSSWGNGHATIWRALCGALARKGVRVVFYERDVPYYARHRDLVECEHCELVLYKRWEEVRERAWDAAKNSDCAMVTSYCPDAEAACALVLDSGARVRAFYARLRNKEEVDYIPTDGFAAFDLVLTYTGGSAIKELRERLGARRVVALYGCADPRKHNPVASHPRFAANLSYLGTYAHDRQQMLDELFLKPARLLPDKRFIVAGAQYPAEFPWSQNIWFVRHLPPAEHSAFYCSSAVTLSVTRSAMAAMGYCPSGRLFEAAACGVPVVSDSWRGLETFFEPGREILIAKSAEEMESVLSRDDAALRAIGDAARRRVLSHHTSDQRATELLSSLE